MEIETILLEYIKNMEAYCQFRDEVDRLEARRAEIRKILKLQEDEEGYLGYVNAGPLEKRDYRSELLDIESELSTFRKARERLWKACKRIYPENTLRILNYRIEYKSKHISKRDLKGDDL